MVQIFQPRPIYQSMILLGMGNLFQLVAAFYFILSVPSEFNYIRSNLTLSMLLFVGFLILDYFFTVRFMWATKEEPSGKRLPVLLRLGFVCSSPIHRVLAVLIYFEILPLGDEVNVIIATIVISSNCFGWYLLVINKSVPFNNGFTLKTLGTLNVAVGVFMAGLLPNFPIFGSDWPTLALYLKIFGLPLLTAVLFISTGIRNKNQIIEIEEESDSIWPDAVFGQGSR